MTTDQSRPKIFVTALPRTGTPSLEYALRSLGCRAAHFPYALFDDVNHGVIRENDAFTDLPIPLPRRSRMAHGLYSIFRSRIQNLKRKAGGC